MKKTLEEKISEASSLLDVLNIVKEKTMLDTHVATLAYVDEIIKQPSSASMYGCLRVKPFPLNNKRKEYAIQAYYFDATHIYEQNDIVLVIFTDINFVSSLNDIDYKPKNTNDELTHSMSYGIVIPLQASHSE